MVPPLECGAPLARQENRMPFAVCVTLQIEPGRMDAFMPLMRANAAASLRNEAACHQFDVARDAARPDEVFLYEVYTDAAGFDAHLQTDHFKQFDAAVADMVAQKDVRTYAQVNA
jgi:quinol monooxygenase YgiN